MIILSVRGLEILATFPPFPLFLSSLTLSRASVILSRRKVMEGDLAALSTAVNQSKAMDTRVHDLQVELDVRKKC